MASLIPSLLYFKLISKEDEKRLNLGSGLFSVAPTSFVQILEEEVGPVSDVHEICDVSPVSDVRPVCDVSGVHDFAMLVNFARIVMLKLSCLLSIQ